MKSLCQDQQVTSAKNNIIHADCIVDAIQHKKRQSNLYYIMCLAENVLYHSLDTKNMLSEMWLIFADVYNIVSDRGTVGKFCLFKSAYRIGEEIVGSFDFSDSLIVCQKVCNI